MTNNADFITDMVNSKMYILGSTFNHTDNGKTVAVVITTNRYKWKLQKDKVALELVCK